MSEQETIDNRLNMEQQQPIQLATQDAYWQQVRIQTAVNITCQLSEHWLGAGYSEHQIARQAISLADALVAELKKGGNNE